MRKITVLMKIIRLVEKLGLSKRHLDFYHWFNCSALRVAHRTHHPAPKNKSPLRIASKNSCLNMRSVVIQIPDPTRKITMSVPGHPKIRLPARNPLINLMDIIPVAKIRGMRGMVTRPCLNNLPVPAATSPRNIAMNRPEKPITLIPRRAP